MIHFNYICSKHLLYML